MSLGDSILQTASIVPLIEPLIDVCVSVATATDHIMLQPVNASEPMAQHASAAGRARRPSPHLPPNPRAKLMDPRSLGRRSVPRIGPLPGLLRLLLTELSEVLWLEYLANLGLAFPSWPVFPVQFHEAHRPVDCLLLRFQLKLRIAADNFLGLCEWPIGHGQLPFGNADAGALCGWRTASVHAHR